MRSRFDLPEWTSYAAVAAGLVLTLVVAHFVCAAVLGCLERSDPDHATDRVDGYRGAGAIIGALERLITFGAVVAGAPAAIAAFLLVKTAARFGEASTDHRFAERFIIGTALSVGIAAVMACVVRWFVGLQAVVPR